MSNVAAGKAELGEALVADGEDYHLIGDLVQQRGPPEEGLVDVDPGSRSDDLVANVATRVIVNTNK
jgi:hypothetical protein